MEFTKELIAKKLNGRKYCNEITEEEEKQAKESNLVIIFGASDDLVKLRGAINDEIGEECCYPDTFYIDPKTRSVLKNECWQDECPYFESEKERCYAITPSNDHNGWSYSTSIQHQTFEIYNEDELYCTGIVFNLNTL